MKYLPAIAAIVFFPVMAFGQSAALPAVLQPDAFAESEAGRLGAGVFKLLPRGTLFLLKYQPPKYHRDIVNESRRAARIEDGGHIFSDRLPAVVDHTYLLRAITFGEADKLVALQIMGKDMDGSLTIAWKPIKDFDVPRMMRQTEEELSAKIADIMNAREFSGITFTVAGDVVTLSGSLSRDRLSRLIDAVNVTGLGKLVNKSP